METATLDEPTTGEAEPSTDTEKEIESQASAGHTPTDSSPRSETPVAPTTSESTTSSDEDDDEDESENPVASLERDSLDFDKATISLVLNLLPHDGHADGRLVLIGIKSHNLTPLTMTRRLNQLSPLPDDLTSLLEQWKIHFSAAITARTDRRKGEEEKKKQAEAERKRKQDEARAQARQKHKAKPETKKPAPASKTASTPATTPRVSAPPAAAASEPQSTLF